jgi:hypothetical protein
VSDIRRSQLCLDKIILDLPESANLLLLELEYIPARILDQRLIIADKHDYAVESLEGHDLASA